MDAQSGTCDYHSVIVEPTELMAINGVKLYRPRTHNVIGVTIFGRESWTNDAFMAQKAVRVNRNGAGVRRSRIVRRQRRAARRQIGVARDPKVRMLEAQI